MDLSIDRKIFWNLLDRAGSQTIIQIYYKPTVEEIVDSYDVDLAIDRRIYGDPRDQKDHQTLIEEITIEVDPQSWQMQCEESKQHWHNSFASSTPRRHTGTHHYEKFGIPSYSRFDSHGTYYEASRFSHNFSAQLLEPGEALPATFFYESSDPLAGIGAQFKYNEGKSHYCMYYAWNVTL